MRRRDIVTILTGVIAAAWVRPSRATSDDNHTIGIQLGTSSQNREQQQLVSAFVDELGRLGWNRGRNLRIELRWGDGDIARIRDQARELASLKPSVIFAQGTPIVTQLRQSDDSIPIVFVNVADPVGAGFVRSFSRPAGNTTGFTNYESSIAGKWVEILKELLPDMKRIAVVANPDNVISSRLAEQAERVAKDNGTETVRIDASNRADLEQKLIGGRLDRTTGVLVMPDFVATTNSDLIIQSANSAGAASIFPFRMFAANGGLAAYSIDQTDAFQKAAAYVDKILRGARAGELPVQAPTKFELIINLRAARTLGLKVPATLLVRADEILE